MISIHFFSCDCTGETSPALNGDNIFHRFLNKQGSFFTILFVFCMMLVPSKINAMNLSTMGSFDIRQLNAQKVSLLFPGSTALDVNGHTLLSGNLDVSGILNVSTGRMYSLGEVDFIQGMLDFGNCKNSVGLKPIAVRLRDCA